MRMWAASLAVERLYGRTAVATRGSRYTCSTAAAVLRYFIKKTRDQDEVSDLSQDTFLTLLRAAQPNHVTNEELPLRPFILGAWAPAHPFDRRQTAREVAAGSISQVSRRSPSSCEPISTACGPPAPIVVRCTKGRWAQSTTARPAALALYADHRSYRAASVS